MRISNPSFSIPNINKVDDKRTVDNKKTAFIFEFIGTGNVVVPPLVAGKYAVNREKNQMPKKIKRKMYGRNFLNSIFRGLRYYVLSAVTTIVTVVG